MTFDPELVEKVARAMADDHRLRNRELWLTGDAWAELRDTSFGLPSWSHYASQALAALSAINASSTHVVAPVVATEEMALAAKRLHENAQVLGSAAAIWSAMLAAAREGK